MIPVDEQMAVLRIGDLARRVGVSVRTVRYYEELGLMVPAGHSLGGFRLYGEDNLKRLLVINTLKGLGLTLDEIKKILLAKKESGGDQETVRFLQGIFTEKLTLLEAKIQSLSKVQAELSGALRILESCQGCDHKVLLDAICCSNCSNLGPRENVPSTFEVILQGSRYGNSIG